MYIYYMNGRRKTIIHINSSLGGRQSNWLVQVVQITDMIHSENFKLERSKTDINNTITHGSKLINLIIYVILLYVLINIFYIAYSRVPAIQQSIIFSASEGERCKINARWLNVLILCYNNADNVLFNLLNLQLFLTLLNN